MTARTSDRADGTRRRKRMLGIDGDIRILFIVLFLIGIGVSLVASSSSFFAGGHFSDSFALARRHAIRAVVALCILLVTMKIDYRIYRKLSPMILGLGVVLLLSLFFTGVVRRSVLRWLSIPGTGVTLQPAEPARIALVFFLAFWITRRGKEMAEFKRGFLPAVGAVALVVGLIAAGPNFGTATATLIIATVMLFVGGARILHLLAFVGSGAGLAVLSALSVGYVRERVVAFLHGDGGAGWQVTQSLVGLGSGGVIGLGFGNSQQKLSWLPDSYTDFIFAILGEEAGMIGTLLVSGLFLLLVLRALKISRGCSDTFGEMLVIGLGSSVFVYAMLNMFVATGMFPVTGLPLPFLSYGGSALLANAFAVGVLLNVSRRRPERDEPSGWRRRRPIMEAA